MSTIDDEIKLLQPFTEVKATFLNKFILEIDDSFGSDININIFITASKLSIYVLSTNNKETMSLNYKPLGLIDSTDYLYVPPLNNDVEKLKKSSLDAVTNLKKIQPPINESQTALLKAIETLQLTLIMKYISTQNFNLYHKVKGSAISKETSASETNNKINNILVDQVKLLNSFIESEPKIESNSPQSDKSTTSSLKTSADSQKSPKSPKKEKNRLPPSSEVVSPTKPKADVSKTESPIKPTVPPAVAKIEAKPPKADTKAAEAAKAQAETDAKAVKVKAEADAKTAKAKAEADAKAAKAQAEADVKAAKAAKVKAEADAKAANDKKVKEEAAKKAAAKAAKAAEAKAAKKK